jgi:hypothetical protein
MVSMLEEHHAMYPNAQLRNVLKPEDVLSAIGDECARLEQEFGTEMLRPFYDLVWLLNTVQAVKFVTEVIEQEQGQNRLGRAEPYRHVDDSPVDPT